MINKDRIKRYLETIYPEQATNADIRKATGVEPHQQVFQITSSLMESGYITGRRIGKIWYFKANLGKTKKPIKPLFSKIQAQNLNLDSSSFENLAISKFSDYFYSSLRSGSVPGIPKRWDMVSRDRKIVGDAKYYTLVRAAICCLQNSRPLLNMSGC